MFLRSDTPVTSNADGFLYKKLIAFLQLETAAYVPAILAFVLIFTQAVLLNYLSNHYKLMQRPNYLVGMSYLLISSLFSEWYILSSAMVANTFFIWIFYGLAGIGNSQRAKSAIYNLGLILCIASFFYYPSVFFLLLLLAGLAFSRPFRLPEWVMAVLGFLTPVYFLFSILFLSNKMEIPAFSKPDVTIPIFEHGVWAIAGVVLISLGTIVGVFFINQQMRRQIVHTRKTWGLIFFYALLGILVPFFNDHKQFHFWLIAAIPISMIAGAAFFYPEKKWFRIVLHWAMVIVALIMGYYFR